MVDIKVDDEGYCQNFKVAYCIATEDGIITDALNITEKDIAYQAMLGNEKGFDILPFNALPKIYKKVDFVVLYGALNTIDAEKATIALDKLLHYIDIEKTGLIESMTTINCSVQTKSLDYHKKRAIKLIETYVTTDKKWNAVLIHRANLTLKLCNNWCQLHSIEHRNDGLEELRRNHESLASALKDLRYILGNNIVDEYVTLGKHINRTTLKNAGIDTDRDDISKAIKIYNSRLKRLDNGLTLNLNINKGVTYLENTESNMGMTVDDRYKRVILDTKLRAARQYSGMSLTELLEKDGFDNIFFSKPYKMEFAQRYTLLHRLFRIANNYSDNDKVEDNGIRHVEDKYESEVKPIEILMDSIIAHDYKIVALAKDCIELFVPKDIPDIEIIESLEKTFKNMGWFDYLLKIHIGPSDEKIGWFEVCSNDCKYDNALFGISNGGMLDGLSRDDWFKKERNKTCN